MLDLLYCHLAFWIVVSFKGNSNVLIIKYRSTMNRDAISQSPTTHACSLIWWGASKYRCNTRAVHIYLQSMLMCTGIFTTLWHGICSIRWIIFFCLMETLIILRTCFVYNIDMGLTFKFLFKPPILSQNDFYFLSPIRNYFPIN